MPKGDAFNRSEVSSVYVSPRDRYVVSFIVGYTPDQVDGPVQAAAAALEMLCGEDSKLANMVVFDRKTGEFSQMTKEEVDTLMRAPLSKGS